MINAFKAAHNLTDVTVVADAGMISEANQVALQAAGLSYILGARIPFPPDVVREWRDTHPDEAIPDQLVLTQPWPATSSEKARGIPDRVTHYQYCHDRAHRTLRGIDEQVAKADRGHPGIASADGGSRGSPLPRPCGQLHLGPAHRICRWAAAIATAWQRIRTAAFG